MNTQEIVQAMQSYVEMGKSAAFIVAVVADEFKIPASTASKLYKANFAGANQGAQGDLEALVRCLRKNYGIVGRKELVADMARVSGYTESTANHMLSQLNFAKEWHKQESAE